MNLFILQIFNKHYKAQFVAKFKILLVEFRTTLNFRKFKPLQLKLRSFLAGNVVAMVTYYAPKVITTCSSMVKQFFDTMILASSDKEGL